MWSGHQMTGWGWLIMSLALVAWLVLIAVAVSLISRGWWRGRGDGAEGDALEILDRRLARGEITVDEHRRLREALRRDVDAP